MYIYIYIHIHVGSYIVMDCHINIISCAVVDTCSRLCSLSYGFSALFA